MTLEQQRIAIAKACGWTAWANQGCDGGYIAKSPEGESYYYSSGSTPEYAILRNCPDYTSDLNAIRHAEKKALEGYRKRWSQQIVRVAFAGKDCGSFDYLDLSTIAELTADERCEAFLRTLNLFVPDES